MTTITAIVPTAADDIDRLTLLRRSVLSALHQLGEGDEIIVAADTTDGPLDAARELCGRLGAEAPDGASVRFLPVSNAPMQHDFGHSQINAAMRAARGEWLTFNDDDDIWAAGAFESIRVNAAIRPHPAPMLFRFRSYHGPTFWLAPGLLGQGLIGGHCIVAPNLPSLLGEWAPHYEGDWSFIEQTLGLWRNVGVEPVWVNRLIAIARPEVTQP